MQLLITCHVYFRLQFQNHRASLPEKAESLPLSRDFYGKIKHMYFLMQLTLLFTFSFNARHDPQGIF